MLNGSAYQGRHNHLKETLQSGGIAFGVHLSFPSPALVEMLGVIGLDWVYLDLHHGPADLETCEHMVRAAESVGITPIVRMPYQDPQLINRYLDTGAMGVLIPHLSSPQLASAVVSASKYDPVGHRGAGGSTRAADFGLRLSGSEYAEWANANTMVFGQLEDKEVLDSLPEILAVDGIDGFTVGPSDMSHSLGYPGQINHPVVMKATDDVSRRVASSGKILSRTIMDTATASEEVRKYVDLGARMIASASHKILSEGAKRFIQLKKEFA